MNTIYLKETKKVMDGVQKLYSFPNGYGASVIRHKGSYGGDKGLWEIAPWRDDNNEFIGQNGLGWNDDVKGHLNDPEVDQILRQISQLTDEDVFCEWDCGDTVEDCTGYKCWER
jgi:hypothetical protein